MKTNLPNIWEMLANWIACTKNCSCTIYVIFLINISICSFLISHSLLQHEKNIDSNVLILLFAIFFPKCFFNSFGFSFRCVFQLNWFWTYVWFWRRMRKYTMRWLLSMCLSFSLLKTKLDLKKHLCSTLLLFFFLH